MWHRLLTLSFLFIQFIEDLEKRQQKRDKIQQEEKERYQMERYQTLIEVKLSTI